MTEWQRSKLWVPGTEQPRGLARIHYGRAGTWIERHAELVDWGSVAQYALPATPEGRREADRIRKANARAAEPDDSVLTLPLPQGTRDALARVCERAGFTDRRELIATLIHNLDKSDGPLVERFTRQDVRVGDLSRYFPQLQEVQDADL